MKVIILLRYPTLVGLLIVFLSAHADASFVLSISQSGDSVIGIGSGTIDTSGLSDAGQTAGGGLVWGSYPTGGSAIGLGDPSATVEGFIGLISGPAVFGSGSKLPASYGFGDPVDIAPLVNSSPLFGAVFVPVGYMSGNTLSDSANWENTTIADLGLIAGTYKYTWGSGSSADSFTISVSSVPEPRTAWLLGFAGLALVLRHLSIEKKDRFCDTRSDVSAGEEQHHFCR